MAGKLRHKITKLSRNCKNARALVGLAVFLLLAFAATGEDWEPAARRCHFVGLQDFSNFIKMAGTSRDELILTSPKIAAPISWNELVVSWNVRPGVYLKVEARGVFPDRATRFYDLGEWSDELSKHARQSVNQQRDADGTVKVDTLVLNHLATNVEIRLTISGAGDVAGLKFLGLSFCDSEIQVPALAPNRLAWGKTISVPERRQGEYAGGGGWCSPTSLSMILAYWGEKLARPELNHTVPEVAAAINDTGFDGTGNWPFNTAYAGSFPGMRAYVVRLADISELEDWIAAGIPTIISVSSYLTNDRHSGPDDGHLIVCCGFTEQGDVVVNDPGVSVKRNQPARRVYGRERVVNAWKKSKNAAYLIYPEAATIPKDCFGHWDGAK